MKKSVICGIFVLLLIVFINAEYAPPGSSKDDSISYYPLNADSSKSPVSCSINAGSSNGLRLVLVSKDNECSSESCETKCNSCYCDYLNELYSDEGRKFVTDLGSMNFEDDAKLNSKGELASAGLFAAGAPAVNQPLLKIIEINLGSNFTQEINLPNSDLKKTIVYTITFNFNANDFEYVKINENVINIQKNSFRVSVKPNDVSIIRISAKPKKAGESNIIINYKRRYLNPDIFTNVKLKDGSFIIKVISKELEKQSEEKPSSPPPVIQIKPSPNFQVPPCKEVPSKPEIKPEEKPSPIPSKPSEPSAKPSSISAKPEVAKTLTYFDASRKNSRYPPGTGTVAAIIVTGFEVEGFKKALAEYDKDKDNEKFKKTVSELPKRFKILIVWGTEKSLLENIRPVIQKNDLVRTLFKDNFPKFKKQRLEPIDESGVVRIVSNAALDEYRAGSKIMISTGVNDCMPVMITQRNIKGRIMRTNSGQPWNQGIINTLKDAEGKYEVPKKFVIENRNDAETIRKFFKNSVLFKEVENEPSAVGEVLKNIQGNGDIRSRLANPKDFELNFLN